MIMRLLSFVVAAVALVGCSESVKGTEGPHECASTFGGEWHFAATASGSGRSKACADIAKSFEMTLTIDDSLSSARLESSEGVAPLDVDPETQIIYPCDYLLLGRVEKSDDDATTYALEILKPRGNTAPADTLGAILTVSHFDRADFDASPQKATPTCATQYNVTLTR